MAERHRIPYTTFTDLARREEVYGLVHHHVATINRDLPPAARIRRFLLLHKELHADDAELTRTRKVRRRHIGERFGDIIAALAGDGDSVTVATEITYQDGAPPRSRTNSASRRWSGRDDRDARRRRPRAPPAREPLTHGRLPPANGLRAEHRDDLRPGPPRGSWSSTRPAT